MKLKRFDMERWFIKTANARHNFSESGVPDFSLGDFLDKIGARKNLLDDVYLGNNDTRGSMDFRRKVSKLYKEARPEDIIITNGTSEALYILFNLILNNKSKVLLLYPAFPMLYLVPQSLGARVYFLNVLNHNKESLAKAVISKIKKVKPKLVIINIPHNPVGFTLNAEEINGIAKQAKRSNAHILFDEHYRFLPMDKKQKMLPSGYDIAKKFYNNVFAAGSIIKCTGIVGVRMGWIIADQKTLSKVRDYKDYTTHCTPCINERISGLAIENVNKITKDFRENIRKNWLLLKKSQLVKDKFISLNYELEGGCVYFPKINGFSSLELAETLFKRANISVMPGEVFGCPDYLRINMAQKTGDFAYLLENIRKCMLTKKK